jgi:hypothetical protein
VQRLSDDEDPYDWQHRGAPPSQSGARGAFGFAFLHPEADSTEGRAVHRHDEQWAETFESTHAAALQTRRDARYVEMVAEAERELRVRNLREEREGDELLELERRDILALRRRLDDEMPWEFGPPSSVPHLYPHDPELPAEEPPAAGATARPTVTPSASTPSRTAPLTHGHRSAGRTHDAPAIGRDSATRRGPGGLRHASALGAGAEPNHDWQHRGPTRRETLTAVFGDTLGGLFGGRVSDADDRAEQQRMEASPELMQQRQQREQELRHVELRSRLVTARREESTVTDAQLDDEAIADIRAAVDAEMPLEFVLPEYLHRDIDVHIDGQGNIGERQPEPEQPAATTPAATGTQAGGRPTPTPVDHAMTEPDHPAGDPGDTGARAASTPVTVSPSAASPAEHAGAAVAALALTGAAVADSAAAEHHPPDHQEMAGQLFAAATDLDLEMLARRLYGRFRRDLRRELLIDRERAGLLADAR